MLTRRGFIKALSYILPVAVIGCSPPYDDDPQQLLTKLPGQKTVVGPLIEVGDLGRVPPINLDQLPYWKNRHS